MSEPLDDPYAWLGVRPIINCAGVRTPYGNSVLLPEIAVAVQEAANRFVVMDELAEAIGACLAALTGAGWGIVTAGSAAALCQATAACVAGNDPDRMLSLPLSGSDRRVVVMPAGQRFAYDHAIRMVGCRIVECDDEAALRRVLDTEDVAMGCILGAKEADSRLRIAAMASLLRPRGIPILVDAASELLEAPIPWLARGASMVAYSSGKFMRAPPATGLLLGEERLVRAAFLNASPHQGFARALKIGKDQMVGAVAATALWLRRDRQAEQRRFADALAVIAAAVRDVPGVGSELRPGGNMGGVPRLRIHWDKTRLALTGRAMWEALLAGEPRIMADDISATDNSITVDPFGLQAGEAALVGQALRAALLAAPAPVAQPVVADPHDVGGGWRVVIRLLQGEVTHELDLVQQGSRLGGRHHAPYFDAPVDGSVAGARVMFFSAHQREGMQLRYSFDGRLDADGMRGTVTLGGGAETNRGPTALAQFGQAEWRASRR